MRESRSNHSLEKKMSKELLTMLANENIPSASAWGDWSAFVAKLVKNIPDNQNSLEVFQGIQSLFPSLADLDMADHTAINNDFIAIQDYLKRLTLITKNPFFDTHLQNAYKDNNLSKAKLHEVIKRQRNYLEKLHNTLSEASRVLSEVRQSKAVPVQVTQAIEAQVPIEERFEQPARQSQQITPKAKKFSETLAEDIKNIVTSISNDYAILFESADDVKFLEAWKADIQAVLDTLAWQEIDASKPDVQIVGTLVNDLQTLFFKLAHKVSTVKEGNSSYILESILENLITGAEHVSKLQGKLSNYIAVHLFLSERDLDANGNPKQQTIAGIDSSGHAAIEFVKSSKEIAYVDFHAPRSDEAVKQTSFQALVTQVAKTLHVPTPVERKGGFKSRQAVLGSPELIFGYHKTVFIPCAENTALGLSLEKGMQWAQQTLKQGAPAYEFYGNNCSQMVASGLEAAGAAQYASYVRTATGIKTPNEVFKYAQTVAAAVEQSRRITEKQIIENLENKRYPNKNLEIAARLQLVILQIKEITTEDKFNDDGKIAQLLTMLNGQKSIFENSDSNAAQALAKNCLANLLEWRKIQSENQTVLKSIDSLTKYLKIIVAGEQYSLTACSPENAEHYFKYLDEVKAGKPVLSFEEFLSGEVAHQEWCKHLDVDKQQKKFLPSAVLSESSIDRDPIELDCHYIKRALNDPVLEYDVLFLLAHRDKAMCLPGNKKAQQRLNQILESIEPQAIQLKAQLLDDDSVTKVVDESTRKNWLISLVANDSEAAKNTLRPGLLQSVFGRNKAELLGACDVAKAIQQVVQKVPADQAGQARHELVNVLFAKPSMFEKAVNGVFKFFGGETKSPIYWRNKLLADEKAFSELVKTLYTPNEEHKRDDSSISALEEHAKTNRQLMLAYVKALYCVNLKELNRFIGDLVDKHQYFIKYLDRQAKGKDDGFSSALRYAITMAEQPKNIPSKSNVSSDSEDTDSEPEVESSSPPISPREGVKLSEPVRATSAAFRVH